MKSEEECYGNDRISLLPDSIICQILSLLPTDDSVKSCTLSKRWRYVWEYVPVINISDEKCSLPWTSQFTRFVDRILARHSMFCLQKLSLVICYSQLKHDHVNKWINSAFNRDIETLDLNICHDGETNLGLGLVVLPLNLITNRQHGNLRRGNWKLKNLVLSNDIKLNVSPTIYLPSLKTVSLYEIPSLDDDTVKNLLAGCPVLEELEIDRHEDCLNTLFIKSSSLKKLKVSTFDRDRDITYIFDAQNLEEIYISIEVPPQIVGISLTSVVWARLGFCCEVDTLDKNSHATLMSLRKVSNVKHLYLDADFLDVLDCCTDLDNLLLFPNLTHLEVNFFCCASALLPVLLGSAPCLISVVIDLGELLCDVTKSHRGFQTPKCTMVCLENIEYNGVEGHVDEMAMIRYFLMNSPVLKKISIHHCLTCPNKISNVRDQIFMFPKISPDIEIEFLYEANPL